MLNASQRIPPAGKAIAVFGRWDTPSDVENEYIVTICSCVQRLASGCHILHGGGPGVMALLARTARDHGILTVGIGCREYDDKRSGDLFVLAGDIFDRMRLLTASPLTIVLPRGGSGSIMEMVAVLERIRVEVRCKQGRQDDTQVPYLFAVGDMSDALEWHLGRTFAGDVPEPIAAHLRMPRSVDQLCTELEGVLPVIWPACGKARGTEFSR